MPRAALQSLDALSFVGRATLQWGRAGMDAASQALNKLDEAGEAWLLNWEEGQSSQGRIPAEPSSRPAQAGQGGQRRLVQRQHQQAPQQLDLQQPAAAEAGWSQPFGFDDSASESGASTSVSRRGSAGAPPDVAPRQAGARPGYRAGCAVLSDPA